MSKTEKENWWGSLNVRQRAYLLRTAGASEAQANVFKSREWYQLSTWVRKAILKLKTFQMAVPV